MKKMLVLTILALVMMAGCVAGPNLLVNASNEEGELANFWKGLWHGFIVMFTFFISLFKDNVNMYEVHNNGSWYNLGFLLGIMIFFGGGGHGTSRHSRCRSDDAD